MLPGGDIGGDRDDYAAKLRRRFPFISESLARHYARTYGSNSEWILKEASALSDLGEDFGHEFYEAELKYLVEHEWVRSLDDAIWRRTKQGMWLNGDQQARISEWLAQHAGKSETVVSVLTSRGARREIPGLWLALGPDTCSQIKRDFFFQSAM